MAIEKLVKYRCDVCAKEETVLASTGVRGWTEVCVENLYIDRDWTDKHICPKCSTEIANQVAKAAHSPAPNAPQEGM